MDLFSPLTLTRGPALKHRFVLAPLTNLQSHPDGRLSEDELHWLRLRAKGGFALTMTCASHVQAQGQGFPGQLGIWSDAHLDGLTRLAATLKAAGSNAMVQLHHAGMRSPAALTGTTPVAPSADEETGARALTLEEVHALREDFISAALRAQQAGFDGVELHGAHGYLLCQFLSGQYNRRTDQYGGSLENRARLLFEIIAGVRARCRPDFTLAVRLSPERFGIRLAEAREVAQRLLGEGRIDFLDLSLWDVFKTPNETEFQSRPLIDWFTDLDRGAVRIGVAGKISSAATARRCLAHGADFVIVGRAAILHHDFPERVRENPQFEARSLPVPAGYLRAEGLGPAFIDYMKTWKGFVADELSVTA
ncbi:MAG TPA: NADH:flavin oxidoreductase [Steroidobacteraceae bacterium]|nr:NADH:flavin oxidoreductase [Steroidobacteraceae bacterium]